ncbi:putative methyltransferase C9orf114 homolog [Rosa chinensis]|uniref:putative methyltransferase C9orf114 homolog n=1 Tax=Rosa chinensis TaxID=74649 RepID=UPI001AD8BE23|nr:putative methyltransferase C9orf114 homolog [Rosa chinensis]
MEREIRVRIGARSSLIQTHLQFKASRPGDIDEREVVTPDVMTKYFIGVTLKERSPDGVVTLVDVGLSKQLIDFVDNMQNVVVDQVLDPGTRVTVAMGDSWNLDADISRQVVSSSKPREEAGMYWGYKVHYASNITSVMIECPYEGGYDHLIGTSEHGQIINSSNLTIPTFRCLLCP